MRTREKSNTLEERQRLEEFILHEFDIQQVDTTPFTEEELYRCYANNTDKVYQYLRLTVVTWLFPLSNEIRAMLGHIADYRICDVNDDKRNLEKAYGHFRRLTLDAFKVLCDEFDLSLSLHLRKEYSYDYRMVCTDYLKQFAEKYVIAKNLYIKAQSEEKLGADQGKHNVIEMYHAAAKEYILLNQFYQEKKQAIIAVKKKANIKKALQLSGVIFGIIISLLSYLLT